MARIKENENNNAKGLFGNLKCSPALDTLLGILIPFLMVVAALLFKVSFNFHMDSDPLWSIGVGEWINNHSTVPYVDVFSWTVAGEQWFSSSWLFCWLMYLADQSLGYMGIALIVLIPCMVTGYFLFFMCKKYHDSPFAIIVFMTGIFVLIYIAITPRSYIYTFAFIAIIMYLIRFKRESRLIYIIPLIMLLWANMHESMRFGILILFVEALSGTVFFKDKRLWPVVILSFFATFINPYGFGFWDISFTGFLNPGTQYISEWRAPDFNELGVFVLYSILFLIGLLGASRLKDDINNRIFDRDKIMILFWFLSALIFSLTTFRAIHYVLLLIAPCFAAFATKSPRENLILKPIVLTIVVLLLITSLAVSLPLLPLELEPQSTKPMSFVEYLQANPTLFEEVAWIIPAGAVAYLKEHPDLQERMFNSYIFGGYLLLNNIEVFIDARETVFTRHSVTEDYVKIRRLEVNPETIINKYAINTFLLSHDEPLIFYLALHPQWEKKYEDDLAVIFTRVNLE